KVTPKGIVSLSLLKEYLTFIEHLDKQHTKAFNHIVDTTMVKFANPLNPLFLRRISRLKNLNYYIVIVPSGILRTLVNMTKWINKPDYVFKSIDDAHRFLEGTRCKTA
ncbi:MAG: hypothetical protein AAFN93_29480, partial [Bacteroidota bacterium]